MMSSKKYKEIAENLYNNYPLDILRELKYLDPYVQQKVEFVLETTRSQFFIESMLICIWNNELTNDLQAYLQDRFNLGGEYFDWRGLPIRTIRMCCSSKKEWENVIRCCIRDTIIRKALS